MADQISKSTAMDLLCAELVNLIKDPNISNNAVQSLYRRVDAIVRGVYTAGFEEGKTRSIEVLKNKYAELGIRL